MLVDQKSAYLFTFIFSSVLAWASFFGIIFFTNPQSAGMLGIVVLYSSVIVGATCLSIILWQLIKQKKS